jgi:hypothetical protein
MKKFLNIFFVTLGVIFFILILAGAYFFVTDPLNLKPILFGSDSETVSEVSGSGTQVDKNPVLNDSQEKALETFGIDPSSLPSEITPEQEKCFENAIGKTRVTEIKNGDSPSALEFFKAKDCI